MCCRGTQPHGRATDQSCRRICSTISPTIGPERGGFDRKRLGARVGIAHQGSGAIPAFPLLRLALMTPREERGRKICRIAVTNRRPGLLLWGIRVGFHHLPIKMPGSMTEHRQNDSETDEER